MRTQLVITVLGSFLVLGCAGSASSDGAGGVDVGEEDMPLSSYDSVFKGAPSNDSLPDVDLKADEVATKSTELIALQSPVRNQARRGVCTIFSTTALMEHLYIKAGMANPDFSEQYLQWSVKKQLGSFPDGEGSDNQDNVEALAQFGGVEETVWPYNGNEWGPSDDADCKPDGTETQTLPTKCWTQGDPPAAATTAKKYKLPSGSWLRTTSIKSHIMNDKTAVVLGLDFFYQAWNHGLSTLKINEDDLKMGVVRMPNQEDIDASHLQRAGHGILIVGWDDSLQFPAIDKDGNVVKDAQGNPVMQKGFYIFKNSWGTSRFGVNNPYGAGYGFIQYKYVEQYGSAYTTTVPSLNDDAPSCQYKCSDYDYSANECNQGWHCDAAGACLNYDGCRN
ncbi:MAG TPA: C1 family peptidase [Polyangia bacterium]|nr:C1 family peptidase [Polyangia bacterium]